MPDDFQQQSTNVEGLSARIAGAESAAGDAQREVNDLKNANKQMMAMINKLMADNSAHKEWRDNLQGTNGITVNGNIIGYIMPPMVAYCQGSTIQLVVGGG